ncbi:hypothetical protein CK203_012775 [Vitis vinifera]|uniref:Uncharacterized protein n=1 Tax=Vitis vinifera TaxID=29760 RepID=A0A438KN48_VITVI|nr:hypothetical protein CK203_012775 [Vitis vinifera]
MGKRDFNSDFSYEIPNPCNSQRKKVSLLDSDDDDSASSSSTSRSDLVLAQGIEDVQLDKESSLDQALDALYEKGRFF